ncbi:M28 family peptidase [Maribacter algicola]|uniref:M28 family peptidase n=1 Tax=Meishania litoralis TaxID=3434685 RepID=A0ACC7LIW3_9FLAO
MNRIILGLTVSVLGIISCFGQNKNTEEYFELVRPLFTGELAYETVDFVEKYWRITGNTGFNKTVYRIAEELEKAGYVLEENATQYDRLTYRIEKRAMENPTWEPVDASMAIIGQDTALLNFTTNRNMIYVNSVSTPPEGITAEVVHIKKPEEIENHDVKGKIVYATFSAHGIFEEAIIKQGALGIITYNNPKYLQPEKNTTSIQFRSFPYQAESTAWGIALSYAANEKLKKAMAEGKVVLFVKVKTKIYPSEELTIVADVKGSENPDERLVFSAHIQEPGANDNASGVGAQLEMAVLTADLLKSKKIDLNRTLTFLWGDEIVSTHRYITEDAARSEKIKWGLSLDMVGENTAITGGSFLIEKMPDPSAIWTRGNDKHSEWGGEVMKLSDMKPHYLNDFMLTNFKKQGEYADWEVNTNPFEGGSDHIPFLKANIPGLLLWHFTDQFYHTDNDRMDKVSQETLKNVGTGALVSAFTLLNSDTDTALGQLAALEKAAENRIEEELQLSLENIKADAKIGQEVQIIEAWRDWYLKAMQTLTDMENTPSEKLAKAIESAQKQLKASVEKEIKNLKKTN